MMSCMTAAVLAISGKRFYGKDTLAELLCDLAQQAGKPLLRHALADQSKEGFADSHTAAGAPVDARRLKTDRLYKERWRPELTAYTEAELARDPLVFCKRLLAAARGQAAPAILISDLRLLCELEWLRERGAFLARLHVEGSVRAGFGWSFQEGVDDHRTETELDGRSDWDAVVVNPGTRAGLEEEAVALLAAFWSAPGTP